MGSVGKGVEKFGQQVGTTLGINTPSDLGNGGPFAISSTAKGGEEETLQRLLDRARGTGPSITDLQYKQALDDLAKSQASAGVSARGVSNAGLMSRDIAQATNQASLDIAREAAAQKLNEQRQAEQSVLAQASAQRGIAASAAGAELGAEQQAAATRANFFGNLASNASKMGGGGGKTAAFGDEVEDDAADDTVPYMLSPGEIVIPKSAAKDKDSAIKFLEAIKFKNEEEAPKAKEKASGDDNMAMLLEEMRKLNKNLGKKD